MVLLAACAFTLGINAALRSADPAPPGLRMGRLAPGTADVPRAAEPRPAVSGRSEAGPEVTPLPSATGGALPSERRWFDGRPVRPVRTVRMVVTAYSPDERSCGPFADGITASGFSVWTNGMKLAAADTDLLPFGTLISVPGYDGGAIVPVLDRGGRIKGHRLDVLFPDHRRALRWGVRELDATVWEYED